MSVTDVGWAPLGALKKKTRSAEVIVIVDTIACKNCSPIITTQRNAFENDSGAWSDTCTKTRIIQSQQRSLDKY